jgi:hypothetical protein
VSCPSIVPPDPAAKPIVNALVPASVSEFPAVTDRSVAVDPAIVSVFAADGREVGVRTKEMRSVDFCFLFVGYEVL